MLRSVIFSIWLKFLEADFVLCSADDGGSSFHLFNSSLTFHFPHGLHRVRVLAVGGGGAGCDGLIFAKARASMPVVDVVHVRGPTNVSITVGRGGTKTGAGMPSLLTFDRFAVSAKGGAGCEADYRVSPWQDIRGIHRFRLNAITKGADGRDGNTTDYAAGGEGGVLINGEGPTAFRGSHSISGQGGKGFGAGGGSGGQSMVDHSITQYIGGNGAPGAVYIEMIQAGCQEELDVIFAVEAMKDSERYKEQLRFVSYIISILHQESDLGMRAQVGLIVYGKNARLAFQPGHHRKVTSLKKATFTAVNPFNNSSKVNFSHLLQTAHLAFTNSSDGRRRQTLVVLTYARNVNASEKMVEYRKHLSNLNVSIIVVGLAQNLARGDLVSLTTDANQVLVRKPFLDSHHLTPWVVDLICEAVTHAKNEAIRPTPVISPLSSTAIVLSTTKETFKREPTQQELAKDLQSILTFNLSVIDINDKAALKKFMDLVDKILSHNLEVGNTTKELPAFQVIKVVEQFAMVLASQLSPHSDRGFSRLTLKSKTTTLSVCALNVTGVGRIPLSDTESGNEANRTEEIILPASVFSNVSIGVGHVMVLTYAAIDEMNVPKDTIVRSKVINVLAKPMRNPPFNAPVEMIFPISELQHFEEKSKCVFWDHNQRTVETPYGWWADTGCRRVRSDRTHVMCHCDHLTNFAVITRVKNPPRRDPDVERSLSIISYVGLSLSLLGCVLTILTHVFLPSLRSDRTAIHVNLVVAIFFSQTLFLASSYVHEPKSLCLCMAVVAYYCYMSVFTWMLVEGVHIYFKVVRVFQESHSRKKIYFLFGWGAPVIATILSAGAFRERFVSEKICWLSIESGAIWTFIGPVLFVILVNVIILCMVMRITAKMFKDDVNASARCACCD